MIDTRALFYEPEELDAIDFASGYLALNTLEVEEREDYSKTIDCFERAVWIQEQYRRERIRIPIKVTKIYGCLCC